MDINTEEEVEHLMEFLAEYSWIYDFQLTKYFVDKVWDKIPPEWDPFLVSFTPEQLNELPFGHDIKDDWPESLKTFIHKALRYSSLREQYTAKSLKEVSIDAELKRGMSAKKQHEVSNMAPIVHQLMEQTGSDIIVDVGSGLGYLGQILHNKYGHVVIGLEGKQSHTSGADKRHLKTDNMNGIFNLTFELQPDHMCLEKFEHMILEINDKISASKGHHIPNNRDLLKTQPISNDQDITQDRAISNLSPIKHSEDTLCTNYSSAVGEDLLTEKEKTQLAIHDSSLPNLNTNIAMVTESSVVNKLKRQSSQNNGQSFSPINLKQDLNVTESKSNIKFPNSIAESDEVDDDQCQHCVNSVSVDSHRLPRVLMIGLHCCGDLTPTMMDYFLKLDIIRGLCCVSCCYHRMNFDENTCNFQNFPLSGKMKQAYRTVRSTQPDWAFNIYSMRLAAQETRSRWKNQSQNDHIKHMFNVAYRGILELFINEDSGSHKKLFRKVVHKSDFSSFHDYIEAACSRTTLADTDKDNVSSIKQRLLELHEENQKWFRYIEPITMLQVMLQPVLEGMILMDRLIWLQENTCHGELFPIFNDHISPRNIALISYK